MRSPIIHERTFRRFFVIASLAFTCTATASEFREDSNGWSWVYQGIGHRQTFVPLGNKIEELRIRVARLNERFPSDRLTVEIRNPNLKLIYARGTISPMRPKREFEWATVKFDYLAKLEPDKTYVMLFHSKGTQNDEPWLINVIYKDIYPGGHHEPNHQDVFFSMTFDNDKRLLVGPKNKDAKVVPINSGYKGGLPADIPGGDDGPVFPRAEYATKPPKK